MEVQTVSLIIAAFVSGSLGVAAFMRNHRNPLFLSFSLLCLLLFTHYSLSVLSSFDAGSRFVDSKFQTLVLLALGIWMVYFTKSLAPESSKRLRIFSLSLLFLCALSVVFLIFHPVPGFFVWEELLFPFLVLIPVTLWFFGLSRAARRSKLTREKLRLRFALWGGVITLALYVTDVLAFSGYGVPRLGTLGGTLYLMLVFQLFVQKELLTAEELVARLALFGAIALILSVIYAVLVSWVGGRPGLFFFNTLIASFVVILLFEPIRNLTSRLARSLYLTRNWLLEQELDRLATDALGVLSPAFLALRLEESLKRALGVESASLYVIDREGLSLVRVKEQDSTEPFEVSVSSPLIEYMRLRRGKAFVLETIENDRDLYGSKSNRRFYQSCVEAMRQLRSDFVLPFLHEGQPIGFCAVSTGERVVLSNEQLRAFLPLSRQMAVTLKNSQNFMQFSEREKLAAVGEMAAGLAHEIKNPLGAIRGAAQLLTESIGSTQRQEFLEIIQDESDRLSAVLSDFLDYAKPRREVRQGSCDVLRVLEHTKALVPRDSGLDIQLISEKAAIEAELDPEILKQVLLNLFLNAYEATREKGDPRIHVRIREIGPLSEWSEIGLRFLRGEKSWKTLKSGQRKPYLEILIEDNGPGIGEAERAKIFQPFFTTKPKGTGLGLAICKRLVEGMGGSISLRQVEPGGATFVIHLPMRRDTAGELLPVFAQELSL